MPRTAELTDDISTIHVAAGIVFDAAGQVLIAQRPEGKHLAGWWEFPGGKIAQDESPRQALGRELAEELNIRVMSASHFLTLTHEYPERVVTLHVYQVKSYTGEPFGAEGQPLQWAAVDELTNVELLPADMPIVSALQAAF